MSPLTRLLIIETVYLHWIRDLIIDKIKTHPEYDKFLDLTDHLFDYENRRSGLRKDFIERKK